MRPPEVYRAINAVTAALAGDGIAKSRTNAIELYQYRSIDDVLNRLAPLIAEHRLCILPRVLERIITDRPSPATPMRVNVLLRVAFDLVSVEDGSVHTVEAYGEALDEGDKGTAKAMSAAYKAVMLQAFCIPVAGTEDADSSATKLGTRPSVQTGQPVEGWEQWASDVMATLGICESIAAVDRVQSGKRPQLRAISRERPDLYAALGECFSQRRQALLAPVCPPKKARKPYGRRDRAVVSNDRETNFVLVKA
ncbi:ERF family protein [Sphingomonas sp. RB1R13]|uniref:ERF family protein n=1 Tax=Sphingomonas sp. RB1R13 TaxID=3096159 RepID=UPI002FC87B99